MRGPTIIRGDPSTLGGNNGLVCVSGSFMDICSLIASFILGLELVALVSWLVCS